jgi:hypothetical protein
MPAPIASSTARPPSAGNGAGLPIAGYDELTARQVIGSLGALKPPDLRKLRDHELRHANRQSVLKAIERSLE